MAYMSEEELAAIGLKSVGVNVRISKLAALNNPESLEIGDNSRIDDFCVISGKVRIGRNVHVAVFCNVAGGVEGVRLDDFSGLAYGCHVFSESDDYSGKTMTNPTVPSVYKKGVRQAVHIGRHVIIGTSSLVFPGVTVAEGCSVGAMSMVTKSTEPWSIYFGCPAKKLKSRSRELLDLEAQYLAAESEEAGMQRR
jgi:acetyltransferase-like isoleucine patch superfamily enzyme